MQAHGGRVELWTAPGAGARFRVLLPAEATDPGGELMAGDLDEADDAAGACGADDTAAHGAGTCGADDAAARESRATDADSQVAPSDP